jgi:polyisoprenyl-phosphate glycosyltransferase
METPAHPQVDIIVPVYNEEEAAVVFHQQLTTAIDSLPYQFKIFYINDGSTDQTGSVLAKIAEHDSRVTVVEFSRNFGHQAAISAGLDLSEGDFSISLDGDGQHPPEQIAEMLRLAQSGCDVVLTQRVEEQPAPAFKRWTSDLFYRLLNRVGNTQILPGAADFRLLARAVVLAMRKMPEYHRFLRGMVAWAGFRTVILPYTVQPRLAGKSKYSLAKMLRLAMDAIFSFSLIPLYISVSLGVLFLLLAVIEGIYVLSFWVTGAQSGLAPGWSSLMFMLLVVGGTIMVSLGFIGIYIGYIFQEVKRRPVYIIRSITSGTDAGSRLS